MGLETARLAEGIRALAEVEPAFAEALARHGPPPPRQRPRGYGSLLRAIVSQQVSTAAAAAIWNRLAAAFGNLEDPATIAAASVDALRAAGLSRQKAAYARSLAAHVAEGRLPLHALPDDDEAAIALLTAVRGLGRWSAEIYLLFAEGRPDAFPAADLALRVQAGRLFFAGARPGEAALRARAEAWRPHRGAAAHLLWHCYSAPPL
ncbi:MAG: DNA-3-methyladenine glycosylase family protein [Thermaurantiacus tibetensis]|uniref:DNA-3-methyladenine glycosylase family protein n=1 Tax=Thermaurantiacus tibetensis TaxID=2759035 RepID=UPI00188E79D4|nr:DNA-3-methyladenine glycosylase 2 family protein [Thermaurantiacus tibetensis]